MDLLPGFTQSHVDEIHRIANGVLEVAKKGTKQFGKSLVKTDLMAYNEGLGTFRVGNTDCNFLHFNKIVEDRHGCINEMNIIADGTISQYISDCPVSPDGYAMMRVSFCVAVFRDDIWGERVYVKLGGVDE